MLIIEITLLLMDKVAPVSIATETLLGKSMAPLGLVRTVCLHIDPQLLGTVGELTFATVGAITFLDVVFAERAFGFGRRSSGRGEGR